MTKILLIGKMNDVSQDIHGYLSSWYNTQLCIDKVKSVKGMIEINHPQVIIINLMGFTENHLEIFDEVEKKCSNIPIIVIGTALEYKAFSNQVAVERASFLERPVNKEAVLEECMRCLHEKSETSYFNAFEHDEDKRLIMMIDDSALSLRGMKQILEPMYRTILVRNGAQAITYIDKNKPDLIILDYEMPVCNGERIFKLLKMNDKTKDIPIIFLTGVSDKENIMAVLKLNPAGYFLKPPVADKLLKKIEEILGEEKS